MARDREKAKAKRAERKAARDDNGDLNPGPAPSEPHRENIPGSLDHASREVDEAEASIIAGADGTYEDAADEQELERQAVGAAPAGGADIAASTPAQPTKKGFGRFAAFLRASWAELQRVQWPDRKQVGQGTAVTLGFVVVAGLYLGLADAAAQEVVDFIL